MIYFGTVVQYPFSNCGPTHIRHNTEFKVYLVSQTDPDYRELIYLSLDWEHPPIIEYDPPLVLHDGDGIELGSNLC